MFGKGGVARYIGHMREGRIVFVLFCSCGNIYRRLGSVSDEAKVEGEGKTRLLTQHVV